MLFGTIMVWWIVVCEKMDLDEKIRMMTAELDRTYEIVRVQSKRESVQNVL